MKKINKAFAVASVLAMASIPMAAFAQDIPPSTTHQGQGFIVNQEAKKVVPGTLGQITDFVNDQTGKFITVTGRGLEKTDQSEIILSITKDTKIVDAKGNKVQLKTIIDNKKMVKAFYSPNITKSLPARGTALTLVVQDLHSTAINGTVTEVKDNSILVKGADLYSDIEDTILLHLADKTPIVDQNGDALQAAEIKVGMSVKAFYGPAVTMSIPAQSTASYVLVNTEEAAVEQAPGTDGIITEIKDSLMTIIGKPLEQGGIDYALLTVDKETEIVDESGNALDVSKLKADTHVVVTYGPVMALSYPARTHADKIIVKQAESIKIEGTVQASDRANKEQVYVNVGSDQSTDNDVILNMTDDTVIIPLLGGEAELRAGTRIVAYHSPIMTRSLPGITNAEIVIITSTDNAVAPK